HGGEHPLLVRNLQESPYARTDPNVLPYGLQTYLGMVVKWKQATVGSLCVVYQTDMVPSNDDLQFMTIIASAIAVEEDRRRVDEALHRSEENFRHSLDDSPLGVRIVTEEGETIYTNRAVLDIYGYDIIDELKTTPILKRYTPESYAEFQIRREKRRRGDYVPSEYEISIVRKDGEVRQLQVFRKEALWNGERQFQVLYNEITERKQAEEALRESEKLYRSLFDNMLNGFAYCQMHFDDNDRPWDFTYLSVNSAFETLTGLRNVAGKKVTEVIPGIREADPELFEIYGRVSKTGKPERFEMFVDSLQIWFWVSVYSPERGYFVAVFDVITERKRAEEERERLLAEIAARNQELESFVHTISHDLRAPLVSMDGFYSLLKRESQDQLGEQGQHYLERIRANVAHMNTLVTELLELSR
ncbi:MAG: PAS domain S-box protein, partial [Thermodesulfobacteriota bacterium]